MLKSHLKIQHPQKFVIQLEIPQNMLKTKVQESNIKEQAF